MTDLIKAEAGIRQLHARYADAVWRQDVATFADCFTENAEWRIAGRVFRGREEIASSIAGIFGIYRRILFTWQTPLIDLGADGVSARTYSQEKVARHDGATANAIGIYFERFADQGDHWRFTWRLFQLQYYGPPDLTGDFFDNPDFGPPPAMPALDMMSQNDLPSVTTEYPEDRVSG